MNCAVLHSSAHQGAMSCLVVSNFDLAVAVGVAGMFMETHPDPEKALSDGANSWPLARMDALLETLMTLDAAVKQQDFIEDSLI